MAQRHSNPLSDSSTTPSFSSPPLSEVILGFTLDTGDIVRSTDIGAFADEVRNSFPVVQEHPPLSAHIERFGQSTRTEDAQFRLELRNDRPPAPRVWLLNTKGTELLQIQPDMFYRNWRRQESPVEAYPRFPELKTRFLDSYSGYVRFLDSRNASLEHKVDQVEVTYVNRIPNLEKEPLSKFLRNWSPTLTTIGELENVDISLTKILLTEDKPIGRLHIKVRNAWDESGRTLILALTARGRTEEPSEFLDLGHNAIVNGFADFTTEEMHKEWGRLQ